MMRRGLVLGLAAASAGVLIGAWASTAHAAGEPEATAAVQMNGRTAAIALPYRADAGLVWVAATTMSAAAPFTFRGLELKPRAGPGGADLAVFTYQADRAGSTTLSFGLVPPGKMLIGPPSMVYSGPVAQRAKVSLQAQ